MLDHIAIAVRDVSSVLGPLAMDLGATAIIGGELPGYRALQVHLGSSGDGLNLEVMEPWRVEERGFLSRFLSDRGEGPHHITFKVSDLRDTLWLLRSLGYTPIGVSLDDPAWMEGFLHPKEGPGTVIQVAQSHPKDTEGAGGVPDPVPSSGWWPSFPSRAGQVILRRLVLATEDLTRSQTLFGDVLGGIPQRSGDGLDLSWPNGAQIRLCVDDGPPGVRWVECEVDDPERVGLTQLYGGLSFVLIP